MTGKRGIPTTQSNPGVQAVFPISFNKLQTEWKGTSLFVKNSILCLSDVFQLRYNCIQRFSADNASLIDFDTPLEVLDLFVCVIVLDLVGFNDQRMLKRQVCFV
jgi:hypothetical protein